MKEIQNKITIAENLVRLRKAAGLTQEELAAGLFVSDKTVSKWERGLGYPEITQLVNIANFFDVSVDGLIRSERYGIAIAGNLLTDQVKIIDSYPQKQMLANITSVSRAVGGCVPNTAIDLAIIDPTLPIRAVGKVGKDECGDYIISELKRHKINTDFVIRSGNVPTSFSDVMNVRGTGERTFFHYRGANAEFSPNEVPLKELNAKMLHVGYILLLDMFDEKDWEYGTAMARFLHEAQEAGISTSIDVVSDNEGKFREKVLPALKYTDNAIMNEIEGCGAASLQARDLGGELIYENVYCAMHVLMDRGVRERVILHCPEAGFILNRNGEFTVLPSLKLPKDYIKGSVGAGDAFCAGCLYGIYKNLPDKEILELASGAAACNLSAADSISGMKTKEEIYKLMAEMPRQEIKRFER